MRMGNAHMLSHAHDNAHIMTSSEQARRAMTTRRATNLSIDADLLDTARSLDINLSRAAEVGIARAVSKRQAKEWLEENATAIEEWNRYVEKNGLPLARHRQF
jgi:antitoxin CcdA